MTKQEKFLLRLSDDLQEFLTDYCNGDLQSKLGFDVYESLSLVKNAVATAFLLTDNFNIEEVLKDEK